MVLSIMRQVLSRSAASVSNTRSHTPASHHRLNRRCTVFHRPSRSAQIAPMCPRPPATHASCPPPSLAPTVRRASGRRDTGSDRSGARASARHAASAADPRPKGPSAPLRRRGRHRETCAKVRRRRRNGPSRRGPPRRGRSPTRHRGRLSASPAVRYQPRVNIDERNPAVSFKQYRGRRAVVRDRVRDGWRRHLQIGENSVRALNEVTDGRPAGVCIDTIWRRRLVAPTPGPLSTSPPPTSQ